MVLTKEQIRIVVVALQIAITQQDLAFDNEDYYAMRDLIKVLTAQD